MRRSCSLVGGVVLLALSLFGCAPSPHDLIARGDIAGLKNALEQRPEILTAKTVRGKQPLHYAVNYKQTEAMELLLAGGADINAQDGTGMTPLHCAAMMGRKEEALWLLDHGADATIKDCFGDTPMHTAAMLNHGHIVKILYDRGLSLTAKNTAGLSPLELARKHRRDKVAAYIERLLAN